MNEEYKLNKYLKFSKQVDNYVKNNASDEFKKELKKTKLTNDEFLEYDFKCDKQIIPPIILDPRMISAPPDLNIYITKLKEKAKIVKESDIDISGILDQIIKISESISNATGELVKKAEE
jgi:hypothetical protein